MKLIDIRRIACLVGVSTGFAASGVHAIFGQPGTLDPTWSGFALGKVITPIGGSDDAVNAVIVQTDGKVVAAGTCIGSDGSNQFCVARYADTGMLDSGFGSGGKAITSVGAQDDTLTAAAIQNDGKIVLAGYCGVAGLPVFCMLRYNSGGTALDSGFGTNGRVFTSMSNGGDQANAIALQPDGKIVLVGGCNVNTQSVFCVARYNSNGSLDTSFDGNGKVSTAIGSEATAYAVALQSNGKIVVAGSCTNSGQKDFCLARYTNGNLDLSFDGNGLLATDMNGGDDIARAVAIQADGKIVIAGSCAASPPPSFAHFCAARYDTDGSLDTSFAGDGLVTTTFVGYRSIATSLAVQPDGKLVLSGSCESGVFPFVTNVFCADRHNSDGGLDSTFGSNGKVTTQVDVSGDKSNAMALQTDGRILLGGRCTSGGESDFCVIRYDGGPFGAQNCKLDIDGDGRVLATIDMLIATRVALGATGSAAISGVTFAAHATRKTWSSIRSYLVTHCNMNLPQ